MTPDERREHQRALANKRKAKYRAAHPDRIRAAAKLHKDAIREQLKAYNVAYRATHQEAVRAYRASRADAMRAYLKDYIVGHKQRHRGYYAALQRKRAAAKCQAIPAWADKAAIQAIYREAARLTRETGIPYEVDHVYPLHGKTVSGLHCEANLQVVPKSVNRQKSNKHPAEERDAK